MTSRDILCHLNDSGYVRLSPIFGDDELQQLFSSFDDIVETVIRGGAASEVILKGFAAYDFDDENYNHAKPSVFCAINNPEYPFNLFSIQFEQGVIANVLSQLEVGGHERERNHFRVLLRAFDAIYETFEAIVEKLSLRNYGAPELFGDTGSTLPVLVKFWKYYVSSTDYSSVPHVDHTGLTLIVADDDREDLPHFYIGPPSVRTTDELEKRKDEFKAKSLVDGSLLLAGSQLEEALGIAGVPHYVGSLQRSTRRSIIGFLVVPYFSGEEMGGPLTRK